MITTIKKTSTKFVILSYPQFYFVQKRQMHRAAAPMYNCVGSRLSLIHNNVSNMGPKTFMSYIASVRIKKSAVSNLANDDNGKHSHVSEEFCVQQDCEKKTCVNLCDTLKDADIKGHNTHKPRIGRFCRFVSETDANGNSTSQYFVPTNNKVKILPQNYTKDVKPDPKQQPYVAKHKDIYDKD